MVGMLVDMPQYKHILRQTSLANDQNKTAL
jgi:hypothetical protein